MANHMEEIAKMLGVELGERFKIIDGRSEAVSEIDFYFSNDGLLIDYKDEPSYVNLTLIELLRGTSTIKRKPWKPEAGEKYWYVHPGGGVRIDKWWSSDYPDQSDINLYKLGNCYCTKKKKRKLTKRSGLSFMRRMIFWRCEL